MRPDITNLWTFPLNVPTTPAKKRQMAIFIQKTEKSNTWNLVKTKNKATTYSKKIMHTCLANLIINIERATIFLCCEENTNREFIFVRKRVTCKYLSGFPFCESIFAYVQLKTVRNFTLLLPTRKNLVVMQTQIRG